MEPVYVYKKAKPIGQHDIFTEEIISETKDKLVSKSDKNILLHKIKWKSIKLPRMNLFVQCFIFREHSYHFEQIVKLT